jgi:hypothetical protein
MNRRTEIERALDGFLSEGPQTVADQALMRALDAVDRTQQRRGLLAPWRFPHMNTYTRLATAAVVAVVALGGALYLIGPRDGTGGPTALPTATPPALTQALATVAPPRTTVEPTIPLDPTAWQPFTTSRYGYTAAYPTGWATAPAVEDWAGQTSSEMWTSTEVAPWADKTYGGALNTTMTGLATTVPAGVTELAWIDTYLAPPAGTTPACTVLAKDATPIVIDGHPARLAPSCGDQTDALAAFVFVGNRMFVFAVSDATHVALFNVYLSTIKLPAPAAS